MKYAERIALKEEQKAELNLEFEVRTGKLEFESKLLLREKALAKAEKQLEDLKSSVPVNADSVLGQMDQVDLLKKECKNLKNLIKEMF